MTAQNDFLPFAGAAGANVMTQAAYAASSSRTAGFSAGVASSAALNKAWRQSSAIASAIAQMIADQTGLDVLDDGSVAGLVAKLLVAMRAVVRQTTNYYQDAGTAANAYVVPELSPAAELLTNGNFATDLSGWTPTVAGAASTAWSAGGAVLAGDGVNTAYLSQSFATTPGVNYSVAFTIANQAANLLVGTVKNGAQLAAFSSQPPGSYVVSFTATSATTWISFSRVSVASNTVVDNVSVKASGELVSNGTFATDASGWTAGGSATLSTASGALRVTNDATGTHFGFASTPLTTVPGQAYRVQFSKVGGTGSPLVNIGTFPGAGEILTGGASNAFSFVATGATTYLSPYLGSAANAYYDFDNVSVKAAPAAPVSFSFRTTRANTGAATIDFGMGTWPLRAETGVDLAAGDIAAGAVVAVTFDPAAGFALVTESVLSQFGTLAKENIGQGLEDDGAGNLRFKLADASLRRTAAGAQVSEPVFGINANTAISTAHNNAILVGLGDYTLTAPKASTLWNGFVVTISAASGVVTFAPNAADFVSGSSAGVAFTVLRGQSVTFACNGVDSWWPISQTTPQGSYSPRWITTAQTLGAGTYQANTAAGAFTVTLSAGVAAGTTLEFSDPFGTWGNNPLTIAGNGATILGSTTPLVCDVSGEVFRIIYDGSDWKLF